MSHIQLNNDLPGILGLMAYKESTALALNQLAETILRGPSTLSQGDRELIAGVVSYLNNCNFCHRSHAAAAEFCLDKNSGFVKEVAQDIESSHVSNKMKALLNIAKKIQVSGLAVTSEDMKRAYAEGASDEEIHDTVIIAAAFCMFNRYVDGLGTYAPVEGDSYYKMTGERLGTVGYLAPKPS